MRGKRLIETLLFLLLVASGQSQENRCANCHLSRSDSPETQHLYDWFGSSHERSSVGCEKCHGGDASTFDSFQAHRGVATGRNPSSPLYRTNLHRLCGQCHTGQFVEFQKSRHSELLEDNSSEGPTCSSCHGFLGTRLPSPRALESSCVNCHSQQQPSAADYPRQARLFLEGIGEVRDQLNQADSLIRRVRSPDRQESLLNRFRQAEVPLIEAIEAGHSFDFMAVAERLEVARLRTEGLLSDLANPQ